MMFSCKLPDLRLPNLFNGIDGLNDANPCPKAKWYRWQWASFIAMLVPMTFFVLVAIPGSHVRQGWSIIDYTDHGWPMVHMRRSPTGYQSWDPVDPGRTQWLTPTHNPQNADGFWSLPENWNYFANDETKTWFWPEFFVNVTCCILACFVTGMIFELRLRRRKRLFRFSLADGLILMVFVGSVLAYYQYRASYLRTLKTLVARETGLMSQWEDQTPVWLDRIFNGRRIWVESEQEPNLFSVVEEIHFGVNSNATSVIKDVDQAAVEINRLGTTVLIFGDTDQSVVDLLRVINPEPIETLNFTILTTEELDPSLHRFVNLKSLTIWSGITVIDVSGAHLSKLEYVHLGEQLLDAEGTIRWLKSLPKLERIEAWIDSWEPDAIVMFRNELLNVEKVFRFGAGKVETIPASE